MNFTVRVITFAIMLTTISATTTLAWDYYSPLEEEIQSVTLPDSDAMSAGTIVPYLPDGAKSVIVDRIQYFISGGNWFLPVANEDGVEYQVVFAPV